MLDILNLIKGSVSKKDLFPILSHLHIYNGRIQGTNGKLAIDAKWPVKMPACTVPANLFISAIAAGGDTFKINTDRTKLLIKGNNFKANIALADHDSFPRVVREGEQIKVGEGLLASLRLRLLKPFIGIDASRPWACGVLLKQGKMYAVNNIVLAQTDSPWHSINEVINIPSQTIDELIRMGDPVSIQIADNSISFNLNSGVWIKSQLLSNEWPDVDRMLTTNKVIRKVSPKLKPALERVESFFKGGEILNFDSTGLHTVTDLREIKIDGFKMPKCSFRYEPLKSVLNVATHIDFTQYPKACPWYGNKIKGVIVGVA